MTKRLRESLQALSADEDLLRAVPTELHRAIDALLATRISMLALPAVVLDSIIAMMAPPNPIDYTKTECEPLVRLAQCSQALHAQCQASLALLVAPIWCQLCQERTTSVRLGCNLASNCAVGITLGDEDRELRQDGTDGLCRECCRTHCSICLRGSCGCDDDANCCDECQETVCSRCQCNEKKFDSGYCRRCFPVLEERRRVEQEEEDEQYMDELDACDAMAEQNAREFYGGPGW
jgi:hypothetical protein